MSRPLRRGRLDVLDRLHPGLADRTRELAAAAVPARLHPAPERARRAGLAAAAQAVRDGPAAAALDTALDARERWPGPDADALAGVAAGRVRAGGGPAPQGRGLVGVPADEAARLAARLAGRPDGPPAGRPDGGLRDPAAPC